MQTAMSNLNSLIEDEQHRKEQMSRKYDGEIKKMRIEMEEYKKKNKDSEGLQLKIAHLEQINCD